MTKYIALLRAVNVGGTGKLPMVDLRAMCRDAGFARVETYIANYPWGKYVPGDDGADGDGDDVDQGVDDLAAAGVGQGGEMILDAR